MKVKVWDPINEDEEGARSFDHECSDPDEDDAIELAEKYAEEDTDGEIDCIYDHGHDIIVLFEMEPTDRRFVVNVMVEYEPSYYGRIEKTSQKGNIR